MRIAMLGAGAWGTALARHLRAGGHELTLWDHDTPNLMAIAATGCNQKYLPEISLPRDLRIEPSAEKAASEGEVVVMAVPSRVPRSKPGSGPIHRNRCERDKGH